MPAAAFNTADFKVFDVKGFKPRMDGIRSRIRPKMEAMAHSLVPAVSRTTGGPAFAHVAQHARRTVNPPDDTWVAFGPDTRGYKKHCHFKVAVSRHCVRFLFEIGPEHADKKRWASAWKRSAGKLGPVLRRVRGLAWFKNEHDEEPGAPLSDLAPQQLAELADELLRTRDGQLVLGRAVAAALLEERLNAEIDGLASALVRLASLQRLGEEIGRGRCPLPASEVPEGDDGRLDRGQVLAAARRECQRLRSRLMRTPRGLASLPRGYRRAAVFALLAALHLLSQIEEPERDLFTAVPRVGLGSRIGLLLRSRWVER